MVDAKPSLATDGEPKNTNPEILNAYFHESIDCHSSSWCFMPLTVEFHDPDGNLKGGWLELKTFVGSGFNSARFYRIELQYLVFESSHGVCLFKPLLPPSRNVEIRLIDSLGAKSSVVSVETESAGSTSRNLRLSEESLLYDDFDGNGAYQPNSNSHLAVAGSPSLDLWAVSAPNRNHVEIVRAEQVMSAHLGHGFVARMRHEAKFLKFMRMFLMSPRYDVITGAYKMPSSIQRLKAENCLRFSGDVCVSAESTSDEFFAGLELIIGYAIDPPGFGHARPRSWRIGIRKDPNTGDAFLCARDENGFDANLSVTEDLMPASLDTWYTIGIESVVDAHNIIHFDFLVAGQPVYRMTPEEYAQEILHFGLVNKNQAWPQIWSSLARCLILDKPNAGGEAIAFFDNIYGVYEIEQE